MAISIGDPAGVGVDILSQTLNDLPEATIFAPDYLRPKKLPTNISWQTIEGDLVNPGQPNVESGRQAYAAFKQAAQAVFEKKHKALVTLPLSKKIVSLSTPHFRGHTEELAHWWGGDALMMLIGGDLRVALITIHQSLSTVPRDMTVDNIVKAGRILRSEVKKYFVSDREPQLHLLGLNPHAGEEGHIGKEEQKVFIPALEILKQEGGHWLGPHPADGFFARRKWQDAVLSPYHDQGMIPVKMEARESGVNVTLGLPFIRTSPDHGTAFDIVNTDKVNPNSFLESVHLANRLAAKRNKQGASQLS